MYNNFWLILTLIVLIVIPGLCEIPVNQAEKIAVSIDVNQYDNNSLQMNYSMRNFGSGVVDYNNQQFDRYVIEGETQAFLPGSPELPSITKMVLIPSESGVSLQINDISTHVVENVNPFPHQDPGKLESVARASGSDQRGDLLFSETIRNHDGFWPPQSVVLGNPVILRGFRMIPVVINPLRWNPQSRELEVLNDLDFELDFTSDEKKVNVVNNSGRIKPSRIVDTMMRDLVVNPPAPLRDEDYQNGSIVYVMGSWDNVEDAIEPLIEWRRRMGWTVEVIRVQQTSTGAIKNALQEAYDEWEIPPEYVVLCGDTDGDFPIAYYDVRDGANHPYETDHKYVTLDGDDILADAAIGRLVFGSIDMLDNIVEKIVTYESDPYIGANNEERGWQKRGAVVAGDNRSGTSSIDVCRWTKNIMERNGYTDVDELYWTPNDPRPNPTNFIVTNFERGISVFMYRGWTFLNGFGHEATDNLRNGEMLPFVMMATCNTGDYGEHVSSQYYYTERFLYSSRGGAIGAVGAAGATHTAYNNLLAAGTFKAIFATDIHWQGWALMRGKAELWYHYGPYDDIPHEENRGLEGWECETYIFNLMGDPATDLYTDVPRVVNADFQNSLRVGESHFQIDLTYDDNDEPAKGLQVCLYKEGDFQLVKHSDAEGRVNFELDNSEIDRGTVMLTVSGHNLMPILENLDIEEAELFIGAEDFSIDDDEEGDSNGNGDGAANPGEVLELEVSIMNFGENVPEGELILQVSSDQEHIRIIDGEDTLYSSPDAGESGVADFVIEIEGGFPVELDAILNLEATVGDDAWESSIVIPVGGAAFEFVSFTWADGEQLEPAGTAECKITIRNIGSEHSSDLEARLISLTHTIDVPRPEGSYARVNQGSTRRSRDNFQISANLFHLGGAPANLGLILVSEEGLIDTIFISFIVDQARDGQPFGPDNYGYICLDDTDDSWFSAPEYNWIEIDPHRRGEGRDTRLSDTAEGDDESIALDLPFEFQYYGENFDVITICTNGWIAMGDCSELTTARNRKLPAAMVAPGMICPFWEDLLTTDAGGIYTYHDEDNNLFIIEWSQMRKLGPRGNGEAIETFEIVLYNPDNYPTLTGDGDILFQYRDITDDRSCFELWDTPFASVGIGSPDQTDGLTYTYWSELADGAAPLEDERAIKFTTTVLTSVGEINGIVTDEETGEPVEGAAVYTMHGFMALTDEDGNYEIDSAPAEINFSITAYKQGYNEMFRDDLMLEEEEEMEINFSLLHPEFDPSIDDIDERSRIGEWAEVEFSILNSGNGPLEWSAETRNIGEANADPWDLREQMLFGEILNDNRINGAVFIDDRFYLTGGGNGTPMIYVTNRDGEPIDEFEQFGDSNNGMKDLAWDGELIWGGDADLIYGFTTEGELISTLESPYNPTSNMAWDTIEEVLWVGYITRDPVSITRDGEIIDELDRKDLRVYGYAYWSEDPDGYNLYLYTTRDGEVLLYKMNTENSDTLLVRELISEQGGRAAGAFISSTYDYYSWVFLALVNDGVDDRVDIWQLDVRRDWMRIEPTEGDINAGNRSDLTLILDATNMPVADLEGELVFQHNAIDGEMVIPISFEVLNDDVRELTVNLLEGWNMISINLIPPQDFYEEGVEEGPDVVLMTEQLRIDEDAHHLILIKDILGQFYLPAWGYCNIPYWNLTEGYQINIDEEIEISWTGFPIQADEEIPLTDGWNMVAYFPDYNLDASSPDFYVLSSIIDHVIVAKDFLGRFMLPNPPYRYSNMVPWTPGQGYLIKVDEGDLNLVYPEQQEDAALSNSAEKFSDNNQTITSKNMSLLVLLENPTFEGSIIRALSSTGFYAGSGEVISGRCGIAVWGDDDTTDEIDGLLDGEEFTLQISDGSTNEDSRLLHEGSESGSKLIYKTNDIVVIAANPRSSIPGEYFLGNGYPNPFNSTINITYGLPEQTVVTISLFDLAGRLVKVLINEEKIEGYHTAVWDAENIPSGLYLIQMRSEKFDQVRKVSLVR